MRRSPEALLLQAQEAERRAQRGKLVVFFGAAPGVGKTYAMLEAARTERDLKRDVVIGVVETHGRYDTSALVIGLEMLPRRKVSHREVSLEELDVDAVLARRPGLVLVDELAHTNAPGSRHAKRWQDVDELLGGGVDVYTTVNVQHLESLNDVVAQITGVVVKETVPDRVLEEATEVRLIDLPPGELLERLAEGRVYVPEQASRAAQNFFRKGNLIALRELALRATAERVDAQMRHYRAEHGIERLWPAGERLLVAISASPTSARLLRAARRMASSLHAKWVAVYVETPRSLRLTARGQRTLAENLRLAEQLGAELVTLSGVSAAEETLGYARAHDVTKIVVGKPTHPRLRDRVTRSFLEEMVRGSGDIDVYVISGREIEKSPGRDERGADRGHRGLAPPARRGVAEYGPAAAVPLISTAIAWFTFGRGRLADVVMIDLLGIIVVAMRSGYGPSILSTVLSVLFVDFFFVTPYFSFAVSDFQHVVTFGVMFVVAVIISRLTARIRDQAQAARQRERRTAALYALTRELAATRGAESLVAVAVANVSDVFDAKVALFLPARSSDGRTLENLAAGDHAFQAEDKDRGVVEWVWANDRPAGPSTDTLPSAQALYVPLRDAASKVGVLGVMPSDEARFLHPEPRALLDVFASQIASALARARLVEDAQRVQIEVQTERLRSSLLSSVSHDLRTPLTVITGAASTLLEADGALAPAARRDLAEQIYEESDRLNRLVRNLLDMTRLASGSVRVAKEWQPAEEVIGAALNRVDSSLEGRAVGVELPADLPLVPIDAVLIEQVFVNLLENAAKYTPQGSPLRVGARLSTEGDAVEITLEDQGPGVPDALKEKIFDKFFRLPGERAGSGAGLGLSICRGIVEAHGGRIWVTDRSSEVASRGRGARFHFTLPIEGAPPPLPNEPPA